MHPRGVPADGGAARRGLRLQHGGRGQRRCARTRRCVRARRLRLTRHAHAGSPTVKYAAYGATKAALPQLARTLQKEMSDVPVTVTNISPGMVQTELISAGKDAFGAGGRFFVNALSEPPEHAAAIIVPQVLAQAAVPRTAGASGKRIEVLSPLVAAQKLARRVLLGENKGRWYAE